MTIYKEESLNLKTISNNEIIQTYLHHYRHSKESVSTRKSNLTYFFNENHFNYKNPIFEITKRTLYNYFDYLNNLKHINLTTKKMKWTILNSFLRFCMEYYDDFLTVIPQKTIQWKTNHKIANSNTHIIATKKEIENILNYYKNIKHNNKYYLIYRILTETGMRKGELINIDANKINTKKRYIDTFGKTGRKIYYISKELTNLLKNYIENERKPNFINKKSEKKALFITKHNKRYGTRQFNLELKKCLNYLHINKNITCHTFRKSINTYRKLMNCSLEDRKILLNHKTSDVNLKSYIVLDYIQFLKLYDKWDPYKELNL